MRRWFDVVSWRLRALFRRGQIDQDLERELRFHLDSHIEELVQAGHPPHEARRIALREFGSTASVAEHCRDARRVNVVTHLWQDIRYAVRGLAYAQGKHRHRRVQMVVRAAQQPDAIGDAVRDAILRIEPSAAVAVQPMSSALAFAFLPSRIGAALVGTMGALGTLLAMVGLYGTVSFAVNRRTSEIGIRMALGASPNAVMRLILSDGGMLVAAGTAAGLALAVVATRPLSAFLVSGLETSDAATYTLTAALLAATRLVATWMPARRAAQIQPAISLRSE